MKKIIVAGIACMLFLGCSATTLSPVIYTDNARKDFTILGEITLETPLRGGYTELLAKAKEKYPGADYVIDVMVDKKEKVSFIPFLSKDTDVTYVTRATVIKYAQSVAAYEAPAAPAPAPVQAPAAPAAAAE